MLMTAGLGMAQESAATPRPNTAVIPSTRNEWMDTHVKYVATAKAEHPKVFFIGDSITAGWTNSKSGGPVFKAEFEPLGAEGFGIGGDRTENVLWRIQNGLFEGQEPVLAVLMIGTNNLSRNNNEEIVAGIQAIVKEIQQRSPKTKILLLGIFPRDQAPNTDSRKRIKEINKTISAWDDGKTVVYMDIGDKFLSEDGSISPEIMRDFLHPTVKGYEIWAGAIRDKVKEMAGVTGGAQAETPKTP